MIVVKNLTKYILGSPLFEGVSFVLHRRDRVGLVGPNGSGKSTLLKIIMAKIEADEGTVKIDNERIGYLAQELNFGTKETVEVFLGQHPKKGLVLERLGLASLDPVSPVNQLSGGQKTRLQIAKILLDEPTFLLLDEPTNHLDLKGLEWLEDFIRSFKGGILIVSHDRRLLDNSVMKILEIDSTNHGFFEYVGGYTQYILEKQRRTEQLKDAYQRQQKQKRRLQLWLVSKVARGKKRKAMKTRIQKEIYNKEISRPKDPRKVKGLRFQGKAASGKLIIRLENISKGFSGKPVLRDIGFEMRGREHILLAGENGSGKTTLLKIIAEKLLPDKGEVRIGQNVQLGYLDQERETLGLNRTVLEEFLNTERLSYPARNPRSILASFLFSGENVFKKVSSLSLGERARLALAKLLNQENELLILDEPTNHLDIQSLEAIEEALLDFAGAILVVSHDRYFLDRVSINRVLTIKNGIIKENLL